MKLYSLYAKMWLKSQMVYKKSFILLCIGQFFVPFFVFIGIVLLFHRFDTIQGFSFEEVGLLYGTTHMAFAISECFARGFDSFSRLVTSGDFDRVLLRPVSTVTQVLGSRFEFTRIGRLVQSLIVLGIVLRRAEIAWTPLKMMAMLFMVVGGIAIYSGIMMVFAAFCFWTIEGLEIANIFTDGGREMSQYPLSIYSKGIQRFFTFVIPFAAVNYLPLGFILGSEGYTNVFYAVLPLVGLLFLLPCRAIWAFGVRHYKSTGS